VFSYDVLFVSIGQVIGCEDRLCNDLDCAGKALNCTPTTFCHVVCCNVYCVYCVSGSRNYKTFKPKKHIPEGSHQFDLMKYAMQTLGSGNLRLAVALPEGEDLNEWVAVNSELPVQLSSCCNLCG